MSGVPKNIAVVGSTASPLTSCRPEPTLSTTSPNVGLVAKFVDDNNYLVFVIHNTTFSGSAVFACVGGYYVPASPTSNGHERRLATLGLTVGSTYTATVNSTVVASGFTQPHHNRWLSGPSKAGLYLGLASLEGGIRTIRRLAVRQLRVRNT